MTAKADVASGPVAPRRVIGQCPGCGRDVLDRETAEEWAAAEIKHHGQPPAHIVDQIRVMATQAPRNPSP